MIASLFIVFFLLLLLGVPIAFSLGISSVVALFIFGDYPIAVLTQRVFTALDSVSLMAIPFFIFAGAVMDIGGISIRIVRFVSGIFGMIRGGLAIISVGASMLFAGVSGSAVADTAAMGSILIPSMERKKYDKPFAAALIASSGTIGVIIPPSIPLIIFGFIASVSVGELFLAGIIPGILVGIGIMVVAYITSVKKNYPKEEKITLEQFLKDSINAIPALLMPVLIIGGILSGIFTATEAGVVAAVFAVVVGKYIYKDFTWKELKESVISSSISSATIMFIIGVSSLFAWVMASEMIPQKIAGVLLDISSEPFVLLLMFNIILLIFGTFLDMIPAMILLMPVMLPIALTAGIDPIHFGIVVVVNLSIGLITPPVGTCLFTASGIARISLLQISRAVIPFLVVMLLVLILVTYFPLISTFLPELYRQ